MQKYHIGDEVWYAKFGSKEVQEPCPVCYGNKKVTVVFGNGDEVETECQYCSRGFIVYGWVTEYYRIPEVEKRVISEISSTQTPNGIEYEYKSGYVHLEENRMFDTQEAAWECANRLAEEYNQAEAAKVKYKNEKSYSWNAGYYLKEIKRAKDSIACYETKFKICKSKSKDKE